MCGEGHVVLSVKIDRFVDASLRVRKGFYSGQVKS